MKKSGASQGQSASELISKRIAELGEWRENPQREKTRLWLQHRAFFERTGIAPNYLRFWFERREKAAHCQELGLTHLGMTA
jgi:hypothetical protein